MSIADAPIRVRAHDLAEKRGNLNEADSRDLERGIYNWCIAYANSHDIVKNWSNPVFVQLYSDKVRSVIGNLDGTSYIGNTRLADRLADKEFMPREVAFMKPDNMYPEMWRDLLDIKLKRDQQIGENTLTAMTDQFRCGRCKKRECIYFEKQLASADEPTTIFVRCINCNNSWKI